MDEIKHRELEVNGIKMHIAEQGSGPLVVLLHGFPNLWYSWRHQIAAIAKAGYHAVAPDLRGYGQTGAPSEPSQYTYFHIVGDIVWLISALGEKEARVVGHDWGALIAWVLALFRPDLVKCVVTLSLAFMPRHPTLSLLDMVRAQAGDGAYMLEFQEPGKAEAQLEKDVRTSFLKVYSSRQTEIPAASASGSALDNLLAGERPAWLTEEDLQYYVDTFVRTGFTGGLNYYRNIQKSWELMAPWVATGTSVPGLVITGDLDVIISMVRPYLESPAFKVDCPNAEYKIVPGCGHFIAEEAPDLVSGYILEFLEKHR